MPCALNGKHVIKRTTERQKQESDEASDSNSMHPPTVVYVPESVEAERSDPPRGLDLLEVLGPTCGLVLDPVTGRALDVVPLGAVG